jgi:hypothetical protein
MTAVEWLVQEIKSKADKLPTNTKENRMAKGIYVDCLLMARQAKEMEKQNVKNAYGDGIETMRKSFSVSSHIPKGAEEYYNETFNK